MTQEKTQEPKQNARKPMRRWLVRLGGVLVLIAVVLAGLVLYADGRDFSAPEWVRERIAARLEQNAPEFRVSASDMRLSLRSGWHPSVTLRDVEIRSVDGAQILALADVSSDLKRRALLRGAVVPKTISLSGIFATLRRDADGRVGLSAAAIQDGGTSAPTRRAETIAALVEQLDDVFLRPELVELRTLDVDAITLRLEDARTKRAWTIDGARLRVNRAAENLRISADLAVLSGGADVATMNAVYDSRIGDSAAEFGFTIADLPAADLAATNPALEWLGGLRAPISGALRGGITSQGNLEPLNATLKIGKGALQPTAATRPVPFDAAQTYFTFTPETNELVFSELSVESTWVSGRAEGSAILDGLDQGGLKSLTGQIVLSDLRINPPDLYPVPLQLEGAAVEFRLFPNPFLFELGEARIADKGRSLALNGALEAARDGWDLSLNGRMDGLGHERLLELWPPDAAPKPRDWIVQNVLAADFTDVELALRSKPGSKPDSFLGFSFENTDLTFLKHFPPLTQASGTAALFENRFSITLEEGSLKSPLGGFADVTGTSFVIPNTAPREGGNLGEVFLKTKASVADTMSLLNLKPLEIATRANLPVEIAKGRVEGEAVIRFPMRKKVPADEIRFEANALLRDVTSDVLIKDHALSAPRLEVVASNERVTISGDGTFDGVPFDATWRQPLGQPNAASALTGIVEVSPAAVAALGLGLPEGSVRGVGAGQLDVTFVRKQAPRFTFSSNLLGVGLSIPELGWSLAEQSEGALSVSGVLGPTPEVDALSLEAPGLSARGSVSLVPGGGMKEARFDAVKVGGWLDAPVVLVGKGPGQAPDIRVNGGRLDMRAAQFGSGNSSGGQGALNLALDRLQITDTIALTNMQGDFRLGAGLQGRFAGLVNGQAAVTGQVEPQGGRSAFRIVSSDAGAVFSAAQFLKQARGGEMSLTLLPVGAAGNFEGALNVQETRIKDAPAIAALINAMSVVGLLEQMNGQGLHFAEVEAEFSLSPDRVTLRKASAVGPSIGLSMDGVYDVNTSQMDMRGVFSPLYIINGIGSVLTRKGEGVFGVNYRLTGPAANPKVQINPLSALTPSFLREIFRGRTPGTPQTEKKDREKSFELKER